MEAEEMYYVYIHKFKNTNTIFYIGSNWQGGNQKRAYEKIKRPKKWLDEVAKHNGEYDIEIVAHFKDGLSAYRHELKLMAYYQDNFNWCWCNGERRDDVWKVNMRNSVQSKKIVAIKNSEKIVFDSIKYTSQQLNIPRSTIHHYLNIGKQHKSGYIFKYSC